MYKYEFNPIILKKCFNLKVKEACKSCKRYGYKKTCPPYISDIDYYKKLLPTYKKGFLFINQFKIDNTKDWKKIGKKSSLVIHKKLLKERAELIKSGHIINVAFGAGSCKLCSECNILRCNHPDKALIPVEGTGLNIIKLVNIVAKINIIFPIKQYFYRIGVILYD